MFRRVDAGPIVQDPKEKAWQRKALGMASLDEYTDEDIMDDIELELVSKLFGLYINKKVPKFGKFFRPATHSEYESEE